MRVSTTQTRGCLFTEQIKHLTLFFDALLTFVDRKSIFAVHALVFLSLKRNISRVKTHIAGRSCELRKIQFHPLHQALLSSSTNIHCASAKAASQLKREWLLSANTERCVSAICFPNWQRRRAAAMAAAQSFRGCPFPGFSNEVAMITSPCLWLLTLPAQAAVEEFTKLSLKPADTVMVSH